MFGLVNKVWTMLAEIHLKFLSHRCVILVEVSEILPWFSFSYEEEKLRIQLYSTTSIHSRPMHNYLLHTSDS